METFGDPVHERAREWILHHNLKHLHGPGQVEYGPEELVVLCLVRDGEPCIRSFIEHHFALGVRHIVFLDNGSNDETLSIAREYDNVTVFRTGLPFKRYRIAMKRYLISRFGRGRWSLCVDVDELFDYPHSEVVSLELLLRYLNSNSYTAVVAHMLDMFKDAPLSEAANGEDGRLKELYRFYDTSDVIRTDYVASGGSGNTVSNEEIDFFRGGIQKTIFGHPGTLTKHPLVFFDEDLELMRGSAHWVSGARVADFTAVLFHYKFIDRHFQESAAQAVKNENRAFNSWRYKMYLQKLEENPGLRIKQDTSRELADVNDLVADHFLVVSGDYMLWVDQRDDRRGAEVLRDRPRRLVETFSRIRQTTRERVSATEELEGRVGELERELNAELRASETLEQRNLDAAARVYKLQASLEEVRASRSWRLLQSLSRLRKMAGRWSKKGGRG
ncbi:MAG: glycosyltransferase family 2 protein [Rubrobacteraceae bacterium]